MTTARIWCFALAGSLAAGGASAAYYAPAGPLETIEWPACMQERTHPEGFEMRCVPAWPDVTVPVALRISRTIERAEGYWINERREQAAAELVDAQAWAPAEPRILHLSARFKGERGDRSGARAEIVRALELAPGNADLWATSGFLRSDTSEALRDYGQALTLDPDHRFARVRRHLVHLIRGDREAARYDLAKLAALEPTHFLVEHERLATAIENADIDGAAAMLDERVAEFPHDFGRIWERMVFLQQFARHEQAIRDLTQLIGQPNETMRYAIGPAMTARLHFARAISLQAVGRTRDARADVLVALRRADQTLLLKMQIFLRSKGYTDVQVTGRVTDVMEDAAVTCFSSPICGRAAAARI